MDSKTREQSRKRRRRWLSNPDNAEKNRRAARRAYWIKKKQAELDRLLDRQ